MATSDPELDKITQTIAGIQRDLAAEKARNRAMADEAFGSGFNALIDYGRSIGDTPRVVAFEIYSRSIGKLPEGL